MLNHTVSRRQLLAAAITTAGSCVLSPQCLRGQERLPRLSFIVVSDTHVGYREKDAAARQWEKTAGEIARADGDLVLHLGDVVDRRQESQYPIYLAAREKIGKPIYEIPGNHDPPELFGKYIREAIDTVIEHQGVRFLLINNAHVDSHDGFLRDDQIDWIDSQCAAAAKHNQYLLICMHVPVHKNLPPDRAWYVKPEHGQTKFYQMLDKHTASVIALMHGHFHNGIRGWDDRAPIQEICFPSALYNQDRKLEARGAPGYNPDEFRPGFTLVTIDGGQMKLTYQPVGFDASLTRTCDLRLQRPG